MLPFHVFAPILLQLFWSKTIFSSFLIPFPLQVRFRNYRQIIFTRNIFSSFPIIHRGKRTFHKMMTFSIRYFVTLRSLHISYGVSEYIFHLSFPFLFFSSIVSPCCRKFISILASVSPVMCNVSGRVGVGVGVGTSVSVSLSASALSYRWLVSRRTKAVEYVGTRRDHWEFNPSTLFNLRSHLLITVASL